MFKNKLYFYLAYKYISSKTLKIFPSSAFSMAILGNILSISVLIIVMSVMNGFRYELEELTINLNSHIQIHKGNSFQKDTVLIKRLETMTNVDYVSTSIFDMGILMNVNRTIGIGIKSISEVTLEKQKNKLKFLYLNENEFKKNKKCAFIGINLVANINARENQIISLITNSKMPSILGLMPTYSKIKICGIFNTGYSQFDSSIILLKENYLKELLFIKQDEINSIEIFLKNKENLTQEMKNISQAISKDYHLSNWKNQNQDLLKAMELEASIMRLLMSMFVLLTSFTMMATLKNLIKEKTKEIAIMLSMGLNQKDILKIFFIIGIILSLISITFGLTLGIIIAKNIEIIRQFLERLFHIILLNPNIYLLTYLPSRILILDIIKTTIFAFIIFISLSLKYAFNAAKNQPSEILKQF